MTIVRSTGDLRCADCGAPINLEQYRRKVPRCDDCEIEEQILQLREELAERERR